MKAQDRGGTCVHREKRRTISQRPKNKMWEGQQFSTKRSSDRSILLPDSGTRVMRMCRHPYSTPLNGFE